MLLGLAEQAFQFSRWSYLVELAHEPGAFQNGFPLLLREVPKSPFTIPTIGAGLMMSILAIWRLIKETRPKK